mgnify:CR=1 FL=1
MSNMFNLLLSGANPSPPVRPMGLESGYFGENSTPGYWWFHAVTQSLGNVLVKAGVSPDPDNMNLLADAIASIARSNAIAGSLKPVRVVDDTGVQLSGVPTIKGVQLVDGDRVRFVGEVDDAAKNRWLGSAAALLMPMAMERPNICLRLPLKLRAAAAGTSSSAVTSTTPINLVASETVTARAT